MFFRSADFLIHGKHKVHKALPRLFVLLIPGSDVACFSADPFRKHIVFRLIDLIHGKRIEHAGFQECKHAVVGEVLLADTQDVPERVNAGIVLYGHGRIRKIGDLSGKALLKIGNAFGQISAHNRDILIAVAFLLHQPEDLLTAQGDFPDRALTYSDCDRILRLFVSFIGVAKQIPLQMCNGTFRRKPCREISLHKNIPRNGNLFLLRDLF